MTASPRSRRKAERPGEILEEAFEEFSLRGYAGTRLEDVARRAGVTKGTIYVYFPTKEAVFTAMIEAFSKRMAARFEAFLATAPQEAGDFVEAMLEFLYGLVTEDPQACRMMLLVLGEAARFPEVMDAHFARTHARILARLQELRGGGGLRAAPAFDFPELICAPALLLLVWRLGFGVRREQDLTAHLAAAKDLMLRGLLAPSAEAA